MNCGCQDHILGPKMSANKQYGCNACPSRRQPRGKFAVCCRDYYSRVNSIATIQYNLYNMLFFNFNGSALLILKDLQYGKRRLFICQQCVKWEGLTAIWLKSRRGMGASLTKQLC